MGVAVCERAEGVLSVCVVKFSLYFEISDSESSHSTNGRIPISLKGTPSRKNISTCSLPFSSCGGAGCGLRSAGAW